MSQYQPKPNAYYRIQNLAFGSYLSITDAKEGVAPKLFGIQDTRKQYWKFVVDASAKNTYKIVNAHPNTEDVDTRYALNVTATSHTLVTKDADARPSVWRINISEERDHCSIITSYRDLPNSRPFLQGNTGGSVSLAEDARMSNQRWKLIEVGSVEDKKLHTPSSSPRPSPNHQHMPLPQPHTPTTHLPVPPAHPHNPSSRPHTPDREVIHVRRIDEIGDGNYTLRNIITKFTPYFNQRGDACVTKEHQAAPPLIFRYQTSTSVYFTMKVYGTNMYVQEANGYVKGVVTSNPTLWYLVKAPEDTGYYVCPKGTGRLRAWNGQTSDRPGIGKVVDSVAELLRGPKEGKLEADAWQRWQIWPSMYPNPGRG